MSSTKQDNSKKIIKEISEEEYQKVLDFLNTLSPYAASECLPLTDKERAVMVNEVAELIKAIFDVLKLDYVNDANLKDTPFRIASMWVNELMVGRFTVPPRIASFPAENYIAEFNSESDLEITEKYHELYNELEEIEDKFYQNFEEVKLELDANTALFLGNKLLAKSELILRKIDKLREEDGIVSNPENMVVKKVDINSLCSHHFISFVTTNESNSYCLISYIPRLAEQKALLGISKLQRIADWFGRRPQLQENLNWQIKAFVSLILRSNDVFVSFHNITHYCEKTRGVESHCGSTSSIHYGGRFKSSSLRKEVYSLVN